MENSSKYDKCDIKVDLRHSFIKHLGSLCELGNTFWMPELTNEALLFSQYVDDNTICIVEKDAATYRVMKERVFDKLNSFPYVTYNGLLSEFLASWDSNLSGGHADFTCSFNEESLSVIRNLVPKLDNYASVRFTHAKVYRGGAIKALSASQVMLESFDLFGAALFPFIPVFQNYIDSPSFYAWLAMMNECSKIDRKMEISKFVSYIGTPTSAKMETIWIDTKPEAFSMLESVDSLIYHMTQE